MGNVIGKTRIDRRYFTGMNSYDAATEIGDTECVDIQNGLVSEEGLIVQRKGLTDIGDSISGAARNYGLGTLEVSGVANLYRVDATNWYRLSGTSNWVSVKSNLTNALESVMEQAKGLLFLSNGTDNVHSINGSNTVTDEGDTNTDPPKGTIYEFHDNRMFASGVSGANEDIVYYSDVADPQTWSRSTNIFRAWQGAKGKVKQLKSFKEKELVIYKEDTILILDTTGATPLTDWELRLFNQTIGCPAGRTIVNIGNDHIFLSNDGVRILTRSQFDTVQAGIISREIQDIIDDINWDAIDTAHAVYFNNKYILALPTGTSTTANQVVIWDSLATLGASRKGLPINSWVRIPSGTWDIANFVVSRYNTEPKLVGGHVSDGQVFSCLDGASDDGSVIDLFIKFKEESVNGVDLDMAISHIFATLTGGENTNVQFFYSINSGVDNATSPEKINTSGSTPVLPIDLPFSLNDSVKTQDELYIKDRGKTCQISLLHNESGACTFKGYQMYVNPMGQTEE